MTLALLVATCVPAGQERDRPTPTAVPVMPTPFPTDVATASRVAACDGQVQDGQLAASVLLWRAGNLGENSWD